MTKILGFLLFISAMAFTWYEMHSTTDIGIDVHASLQMKLADYIADVVKNKIPEFKSMQSVFHKINHIDNEITKIKSIF